MTSANLLALSFIMFSIGIAGFVIKRNMIITLMFVEIMLNSANIAAAALLGNCAQSAVYILFIFALAAAEAGVGLAIVLLMVKKFRSAYLSDFTQMKG